LGGIVVEDLTATVTKSICC